MLPRAADVLRERIGKGNLGLRDPRSIVQGRAALFTSLVARSHYGRQRRTPVSDDT
jgi:hypothetical protein